MGTIVEAKLKLGLGFTDAPENVGLMTIPDGAGETAGDEFGLVVAPLLLFALVHGNGDDKQVRKLVMEFGVNPGFGHFSA